jgi:hypothetical protein
MSGAFDRPIPASIPPITESEEKTIIGTGTIFTELNEKFFVLVALTTPPPFSRSISALAYLEKSPNPQPRAAPQLSILPSKDEPPSQATLKKSLMC